MSSKIICVAATIVALGWLTSDAADPNRVARPITLKEAFKDAFLVGASLNQSQVMGTDTVGVSIVKAQFNTISPENLLKWESVHPRPDGYAFELPDRYVAFGESNRMFIVGHTLVWHNQTPAWVFHDAQGKTVDRQTLLKRLREHIQTVVGRYRGRVHGWDVVNEALNEDGTMRDTLWHKIIGDDYVAMAFEYAHEADPKAELYYNDYSLENEPKREGAVKLVKMLKARNIHVSAIGTQNHNKLDWPTPEQLEATLKAFSALGVKVVVTELDVDVLPRLNRPPTAEVTERFEPNTQLNPYRDGLPEDMQRKLAARYGELFAVYLKHRDKISRVTFWNVTDGDSWLNNWPIRGRANYPLLFDRNGKPKPAFDAVIGTALK